MHLNLKSLHPKLLHLNKQLRKTLAKAYILQNYTYVQQQKNNQKHKMDLDCHVVKEARYFTEYYGYKSKVQCSHMVLCAFLNMCLSS